MVYHPVVHFVALCSAMVYLNNNRILLIAPYQLYFITFRLLLKLPFSSGRLLDIVFSLPDSSPAPVNHHKSSLSIKTFPPSHYFSTFEGMKEEKV